jgi:DNA-binding transcriptional ArsR family regulator
MSERLNAAFSALSDPTRRAILARLSTGEATVSELVEGFELTQPTISSHLKVLEAAGLISRGRIAQTRPCRLAPDGLKAVDEWLERYRRFWAESFDKMGAYLNEITKGNPDAPAS